MKLFSTVITLENYNNNAQTAEVQMLKKHFELRSDNMIKINREFQNAKQAPSKSAKECGQAKKIHGHEELQQAGNIVPCPFMT